MRGSLCSSRPAAWLCLTFLLCQPLLPGLGRCALAGEKIPAATFLALPTRPGVTLPVAVLAPEKPLAVLILLPGGTGRVGLSGTEGGPAAITLGGNFLVRSRGLFLAQGLAVLVADVPSDQPDGLGAAWRVTEAHLADISALVDYARERFGQRPWLAGTSMGSISAGFCAARLGDALAGVLLASSVTRTAPDWRLRRTHARATLDTGLERIAAPALVLRHAADACIHSPPQDGPLLLERLTRSARKALLTYDGGLPPQGAPCEARTAHGFLGIEEQVVAAMAAFILDQGRP